MALKCLALIMQLSYDFLPVSDKSLFSFHPESDYFSRVLGHSTSIWKEGIITPNSLFRTMMLFKILFYTMVFHFISFVLLINLLSKHGYQLFTGQQKAPLGFTEHSLVLL